MAREFPPPEQATSWEEFQARYIREWAYHNNRTRSLRSIFMGMVGCFLLIVAFIFLLYAIGKMHGPGHAWQWLGVAIPVAIVAAMLRRAWILGSRDGKRQSQLEVLKQEWQQRVDRGEIPRTRAEAEGRTS
jgi:hypothetical protein